MKYLIFASLFAVTLAAQDRSDLSAAMKLREELVRDVTEKKETPEASLAKLKTQRLFSGLKVDQDADFALAAIDVGQRLLATGRPEAAEKFFLEAEKSLTVVIRITPDRSAAEKSLLLQQRAMIRSNFLNQKAKAKEDLDAAVALQPEDKLLGRRRDQLVGELQLLGRLSRPKF